MAKDILNIYTATAASDSETLVAAPYQKPLTIRYKV